MEYIMFLIGGFIFAMNVYILCSGGDKKDEDEEDKI